MSGENIMTKITKKEIIKYHKLGVLTDQMKEHLLKIKSKSTELKGGLKE